jgi:mono/diheme cytochrome c family protein
VSKWNLKNKVVLSAGAIALLPFLSSSTRTQDTGESLFKGKCAMCHGLQQFHRMRFAFPSFTLIAF